MIRETIKRRLAAAPATAKVDLAKLSGAAEGMSFGEIVKACDEAIKEALLQDREELRTADLLSAIRERRTFAGRRK